MWLQGHMDQMQPAGSGPWGHMSLTGELIRAFPRHQQDGTSGSNPKHYRLALMMDPNCMDLQLHQTVEKVEAGQGETISQITHILYLMV